MSPQLVWIVARAGGLVSAGFSSRPSGRGLGLGTDLQPVGTAAPPGGGRSVVEVLDGLLEPQPARARTARMTTRARTAAEHTSHRPPPGSCPTRPARRGGAAPKIDGG